MCILVVFKNATPVRVHCIYTSHIGSIPPSNNTQLNPDVSAFQRKFTNDVRRCDEMERKLRFLLNELDKVGIEPRPAGSVEAPDPQGTVYMCIHVLYILYIAVLVNVNTESCLCVCVCVLSLIHI